MADGCNRRRPRCLLHIFPARTDDAAGDGRNQLPRKQHKDSDAPFLVPAEAVSKMAALGFMGIMVDPKFSGGGMDTISYTIAMEEIARIDASASVIMSVNNSLVCSLLSKFGNNFQKEATISSFWMDQTEITNLQYREYTHWIKRVFWEDGEGEFSYLYAHALPDTTVWRSELSYNEPMVNHYFRHPAYQDYPVVGVNWQQSVDYC